MPTTDRHNGATARPEPPAPDAGPDGPAEPTSEPAEARDVIGTARLEDEKGEGR